MPKFDSISCRVFELSEAFSNSSTVREQGSDFIVKSNLDIFYTVVIKAICFFFNKNFVKPILLIFIQTNFYYYSVCLFFFRDYGLMFELLFPKTIFRYTLEKLCTKSESLSLKINSKKIAFL